MFSVGAAAGKMTLSPLPGGPAGFQLAALFQEAPAVPVHVKFKPTLLAGDAVTAIPTTNAAAVPSAVRYRRDRRNMLDLRGVGGTSGEPPVFGG